VQTSLRVSPPQFANGLYGRLKEGREKGIAKPRNSTLRFRPARSSFCETGQALTGAALNNGTDACGVAKLRRIVRNRLFSSEQTSGLHAL